MSKVERITKRFNDVINDVKRKALATLKTEAVKSIKKNFSAKGRPAKWEPRKKISKKQRGTNLMAISGNLSNVGAEADISNNKVTLKTNPLARNYARINNEGEITNVRIREVKVKKSE